MLLLIPSSRIMSAGIETIYIPLCFYLYKVYLQIFVQLHQNLHSTMLLLIPDVYAGQYCNYSFTFHYASTYTGILPYPSTPALVIYIPLCFYLYTYPHSRQIPFIIFTFHYASTYTAVNEIDRIMREKFTFHYASTYTQSTSIKSKYAN